MRKRGQSSHFKRLAGFKLTVSFALDAARVRKTKLMLLLPVVPAGITVVRKHKDHDVSGTVSKRI